MSNRKGGFRRKTRYKLSKNYKEKGKVTLIRYLQKFKSNERVLLKLEPSFHNGIFPARFHGKTGTIKGTQGLCYKVLIKDYNKEKTLLVHPVHLRRM